MFKVLGIILYSEFEKFIDLNLLVGNEIVDDVVVYDIGNGVGIISIIDFFMLIVDDLFDFGWIVVINVISDIFVMGGKLIMVIVILGFLINKFFVEVV